MAHLLNYYCWDVMELVIVVLEKAIIIFVSFDFMWCMK